MMDFTLYWMLLCFFIPGLLAVMEFEKQLVRGQHLIIGTVHLPPYIVIKRHGNGTVREIDGFVHQIVVFLANKFNFTFEYVESTNGVTGACVNHTCNGLVGMLMRGEIDLAATGLAMSLSRYEAIDFTFQFHSEPNSLLIPFPRKDNNLDSITEPFNTEVWVMLSISMVACALALMWINRMGAKWFSSKAEGIINAPEPQERKKNLSYYFMFLLSVIVNGGFEVPLSLTGAFRIVVAAWCLLAVVLCNSYNQSIKSYMMTPRFKPLVDSVDSVMRDGQYSIVIEKYSCTWSNLMGATSGAFAAISEYLQKNPESVVDRFNNVGELVTKKNKILTQFESTNLALVEQDFNDIGECRLFTNVDKWLEDSRIGFGLPKHSHLLNHFLSHELMWLRQSGLLKHWMNEYWPRMNRCTAPMLTATVHNNEPLSLDDFYGTFVMFGGGILLCCTVYILELLRFYCRGRRQLLPQNT